MTFARSVIGILSLLFYWSTPQASAQGYPPKEAVTRMTVAEGFAVELVAAEPLVRQPVAIDFDDRGRLWVLQYLQYPNPAGLKRVKVDRYSRTTYDRVPKPPPHGPKGADRLTILEDTDGDGRIDKANDFISDLNIATGFQFGYGGVFVLQTPYLLFYPDRNRDDIPDGDPEVLLTGFGMEDTSSLANSLIWGPDGWLYGTQGTNITAKIRGIEFEQGVWRYHPVSKKFELFIEGASNMWGLEFDHKGNLLAGTNYGGYLMFHGVQGAYYQKSFAKHGELHNPFAFGYFQHVPHKNFQGGHVTVGGFLYQSDSFPPQFRNKYIAVDTLGHAVRWHHVKPDRSTLKSENGGVLLQANDNWFAPSDCTMGPDGAVYIADWYDQRTAHPDPDATWDRSNGRIYRLRWNGAESPFAPRKQRLSATFAERKATEHIDPQSLSSEQLVGWLSSTNEWQVRRARRVLAERDDGTTTSQLRTTVLESENDHQVLQSLWALAAIGEFDEQLGVKLLDHRDANVRAWSVRLLGDKVAFRSAKVADKTLLSQSERRLWQKLVEMANSDSSAVVVSQLVSSAKRLPAERCIPISRAIASRSEFQNDPHIPLLTWWAIERHSISAVEDVLQVYANPDAWEVPLVRDVILGRLMRRYAGDGSQTALVACARLLRSAPDEPQRRRMITELDAGLKMLGRKKLPRLPLPDSSLAINQTEEQRGAKRLEVIPAELDDAWTNIWKDDTTDALIIRVSIRLGRQAAIDRVIALVVDKNATEKTRLSMLEILQELADAKTCVGPGLKLVTSSQSSAIQLAALKLLGRFS